MSRVCTIISALVICIIVCLSWAVNHYRDNAVHKPATMSELAKRNLVNTKHADNQRDVPALICPRRVNDIN